jgi:hypothetical protein
MWKFVTFFALVTMLAVFQLTCTAPAKRHEETIKTVRLVVKEDSGKVKQATLYELIYSTAKRTLEDVGLVVVGAKAEEFDANIEIEFEGYVIHRNVQPGDLILSEGGMWKFKSYPGEIRRQGRFFGAEVSGRIRYKVLNGEWGKQDFEGRAGETYFTDYPKSTHAQDAPFRKAFLNSFFADHLEAVISKIQGKGL